MVTVAFQPEPIYTIIPLDMPDVNARVALLKRAIADYVAEYNVCKCKPCQNGGTVALVDAECLCLCPHMFQGLACQNFKPEGANVNGERRRGRNPLDPNCGRTSGFRARWGGGE